MPFEEDFDNYSLFEFIDNLEEDEVPIYLTK